LEDKKMKFVVTFDHRNDQSDNDKNTINVIHGNGHYMVIY